jgi:hypothetical protein
MEGAGFVNAFRYVPEFGIKGRIKVTLDELRKIAKVACKVEYVEEDQARGK